MKIFLIALAAVTVLGSSFYGYQKYEERMASNSETPVVTTTNIDRQAASATATTTKTVNTKSEQGVGGIKIKADITADVTQTVNCGDESCFEKKFATCQPATLTADTGALGAVAYTIKGAVAGGCKMSMKYTASPNPAWTNKEMTCVYDNKLGFQTAVEKTFEGVISGSVVCDGALYSALKAL